MSTIHCTSLVPGTLTGCILEVLGDGDKGPAKLVPSRHRRKMAFAESRDRIVVGT